MLIFAGILINCIINLFNVRSVKKKADFLGDTAALAACITQKISLSRTHVIQGEERWLKT